MTPRLKDAIDAIVKSLPFSLQWAARPLVTELVAAILEAARGKNNG